MIQRRWPLDLKNLSQDWSGFNSLKRQLQPGSTRGYAAITARPSTTKGQIITNCGHASTRNGTPADRRRPAEKRKVENGHTRKLNTDYIWHHNFVSPRCPPFQPCSAPIFRVQATSLRTHSSRLPPSAVLSLLPLNSTRLAHTETEKVWGWQREARGGISPNRVAKGGGKRAKHPRSPPWSRAGTRIALFF